MRSCQRPLHKLRLRAGGLTVALFAPGTMTAINSDDQARARLSATAFAHATELSVPHLRVGSFANG